MRSNLQNKMKYTKREEREKKNSCILSWSSLTNHPNYEQQSVSNRQSINKNEQETYTQTDTTEQDCKEREKQNKTKKKN